eukprot:7230997-Prymnesium_polylepis.1
MKYLLLEDVAFHDGAVPAAVQRHLCQQMYALAVSLETTVRLHSASLPAAPSRGRTSAFRCCDVGPGLRFIDIHQLDGVAQGGPDQDKDAAREALGIDDTTRSGAGPSQGGPHAPQGTQGAPKGSQGVPGGHRPGTGY